MMPATQRTGLLRFGARVTMETMRCSLKSCWAALAAALILPLDFATVAQGGSTVSGAAQTNQPIAWSEVGARATAHYSGEALAVFATQTGAVRLRCDFQRLEGEVTQQGLWLTSTARDQPQDRFRVRTDYLGRDGGTMAALPESGAPGMNEGRAQFARPGLVEEYSVSVDGVRQDVTVADPPRGAGPLRVEMSVVGARVAEAAGEVTLTLEKSGRRLAYNRLRVVDAIGSVLNARMEVACGSRLVVVVDERGARYPVRIDPTFSDANWVSVGGPAAAASEVFAEATDGVGDLYVGGSFTVIGTVVATNVAMWDGTSWSALGSGISGGSPASVNALAVGGAGLYAGGSFTVAGGAPATNIAQWNGTSWSALGLGVNGVVNALASSSPDLYVGGSFTVAGGFSAKNIAEWNGSAWFPLGLGMNGSVNALLFNGQLYAGGAFTNAGGSSANYIAQWNGSSWTNLGLGIGLGQPGQFVSALAASGANLYAGGRFAYAGEFDANNVAVWNGSDWSALGSLGSRPGFSSSPAVYALAASGTNVYAGGSFSLADSTWVNYVAEWNGASWGVVGDGSGMEMNGYVQALIVDGTALYAGGSFTTPANAIAESEAFVPGTFWSALGGPGNFSVEALVVSGTNVYVGGSFTNMGGVSATNVAEWDGENWSALGLGINGEVSSMAMSGTNLYVGGFFNAEGSVPGTNVAKWDGCRWSALGPGVNIGVYALAVSGTNLFVGGPFFAAGGLSANCIAKWDGSNWSALSSGMSDPDGAFVVALAVSGTNLYAGGRFSTAGEVSAANIAKWDGNSWSALGSGLTGGFMPYVESLAVSGTNLYAGGEFTNAGGFPAYNIAEWNGRSWSVLGSGLGVNGLGQALALAASGTNLYVGGRFSTAGGVAAANIAAWDGNSWSALGSGMNDAVYGLGVSGSELYAGGAFTTAGGQPAAYMAKARIGSIANSIVESNPQSNPTAIVTFFGVVGYEYDVQRATNLAAPIIWTTITTNPLSPAVDGSFSFTDLSAPPGMAYYRSLQH